MQPVVCLPEAVDVMTRPGHLTLLLLQSPVEPIPSQDVHAHSYRGPRALRAVYRRIRWRFAIAES